MKKTTAILLLSTLIAMGQGVVNFSTRISGTVVAHVYAESQDISQTGNSPAETPAGTTIYSGPLLTGSGFTAQLWAANGANQPEDSLVAVPGAITSFRSGAILAGTPAPLVLPVPIVPVGGTGTYQIRVWDNFGGTIASFETAVYKGRSDPFNVRDTCDGIICIPADFATVRSFSFYDPLFVPEPSTYALLGFGGLGLWLFRRKQPAT